MVERLKQNHFNEKEKIKSHVLARRPSCWQVGLGTLTSICHVHGTHYTYCSASTELVTIFYVVAFRPSLPHGRQREGLRKAMAGLHGSAGAGGAAGGRTGRRRSGQLVCGRRATAVGGFPVVPPARGVANPAARPAGG